VLYSPTDLRGNRFSVVLSPGWTRHYITGLLDQMKVLHRPPEGFAYRSYPCWCNARDDQPLLQKDRFDFWLDTVICRSCGTIRLDPYISAEDGVTYYTDVYPRAYFDQGQSLEDRYVAVQSATRAHLFAEFLAEAREKAGRPLRIVDYGGGTGGRLEMFKEDNEIFVYDLNPERTRFAVEHGYRAFEADLVVDVAYSCHTMEHWIDLTATTRAFLATLDRKNGIAIIELPFLDRIVSGARARGLRDEVSFPHKWYFFVDSLRLFMASFGFSCIASNGSEFAIFRHDERTAALEARSLSEEILSRNIRKLRRARRNGILKSLVRQTASLLSRLMSRARGPAS